MREGSPLKNISYNVLYVDKKPYTNIPRSIIYDCRVDKQINYWLVVNKQGNFFF